MIIDAKDMILGRLATKIAKLALLGEEIIVVNSKYALISGDKVNNFENFKQKQDRGTYKGPFYPKNSAGIVKRVIRGMLPFKKQRGREAFKRIKCFVEIPKNIDQTKITKFDEFSIKNSKGIKKYCYIYEISKHNGGKK